MAYRITVLPQNTLLWAEDGDNLLSCLRQARLQVDAPCGGEGKCGKCKVLVNGQEALACHTAIHGDMTVTLPSSADRNILTNSLSFWDSAAARQGAALAFDIGTTTVVGYLLREGKEIGCESRYNPQTAFGADVISRINLAIKGHRAALTSAIQSCVEEMARCLCLREGISPADIEIVSIVGNPAMQQLFLGLDVENLAKIPFVPLLTEAKTVAAKPYIPCCENAKLLLVPNISGFVGADTVACLLATEMDRQESLTLLVDIGTNGEMVLGNKDRRLSCSTAAGPALEGANIGCGMRGQAGAIDHVWLENGTFRCSVIGGGEPTGICGSGLVDAVAAALDAGLLNHRGRVQNEARSLQITDTVFLSQEDIRQLQLAKGAIRAGIELLIQQMGIEISQIGQVYLAGAFGSFMNAHSACRIGLLPPLLEKKITAVGNAAGSGAKLLALEEAALPRAQMLAQKTEAVELSTLPQFPKTFAKQMEFDVRR